MGRNKKLRDPGEENGETEDGIFRDREEGAKKPSRSKKRGLGPEGTGEKAIQEPWGPGKGRG